MTVALTIAGIAVSSRTSAYCRTTDCPTCDADPITNCRGGDPIAWPTSCLTFAMHYGASKKIDLATATGVVEKAFAAWTDAGCPDGGRAPSIKVDHHFGEVACNLREYNRTDGNANIILFHDDTWPYDRVALGLTTVTYKAGLIVDADMEINATQPLSIEDPVPPTRYDLQSIVTHEAGHFLGLAHSNDLEATMRQDYASGADSFRTLAPDDMEGICAVYPPGQAAQCNSTPDQGFSTVCGIFPSGGGGMCSLAALRPARPSPPSAGWFEFGTAMIAVWLGWARTAFKGRRGPAGQACRRAACSRQ